MSRLLLDEDTFERCPGASVSDHDLLGLVHHLRVVNTTRARVLLFKLLDLALLLSEIGRLVVMVNALRSFALVLNSVCALDRWSHGTTLLSEALYGAGAALRFQCFRRARIGGRLIQTFQIVRWRLVTELGGIVASLRVVLVLHAWQLQCLARLADAVR